MYKNGLTHNIYKAFDGDPSLGTRCVFLEISKAFDKVWHKGLLHKLKCYGINGKLLKLKIICLIASK